MQLQGSIPSPRSLRKLPSISRLADRALDKSSDKAALKNAMGFSKSQVHKKPKAKAGLKSCGPKVLKKVIQAAWQEFRVPLRKGSLVCCMYRRFSCILAPSLEKDVQACTGSSCAAGSTLDSGKQKRNHAVFQLLPHLEKRGGKQKRNHAVFQLLPHLEKRGGKQKRNHAVFQLIAHVEKAGGKQKRNHAAFSTFYTS